MRDHLIGYLLNALDPSEHEMVEAELGRDPQLRSDLDVLSRALAPLAADKEHYTPPLGLAQRTCEFVTTQARVSVAPAALATPSYWRLTDFAVAAGIFLAASLLFVPAISQSRFAMRVTQCQDNLRQIGRGLAEYSNAHQGYFPALELDGNSAAAGIYAPRLIENRFISGPQLLICPASSLANRAGEFKVPLCRDLERAERERLRHMHREMGGSCGYNLGYVCEDGYHPTKNLGRERFAIMADVPRDEAPHTSLNHDGKGQNVLFEDGHVLYMTTCKAAGCSDDIFVNDSGETAPGLHVDDAVVAPSQVRPKLIPAKSRPLQELNR